MAMIWTEPGTGVDTMKQVIVDIVKLKPGINGVNLVLDVMAKVNPVRFSETEYRITLENLIYIGEIIEIEYILPEMDYRVKSLHFPKGTTFPNIARK